MKKYFVVEQYSSDKYSDTESRPETFLLRKKGNYGVNDL